ncbi:MAG: methyl-accepting chemotaxis protein [Alcanivoracaceae bacterium]|nr:methyl-accepting chemotaxis protein [Alcanivoracaceae bacterium]
MAMLENIRLSTRINLQQAVVIVGLIGLSAFSLYSMRGIDHEMISISDEMMPLMEDVTVLTEDQQKQSYLMEKLLRYSGVAVDASKRQAVVDATISAIGATERAIQEEIEKTREDLRRALAMDNSAALQQELEELTEDINRIASEHNHFAEAADQIITLIRSGRVAEAGALADSIEDEQEALQEHLHTLLKKIDHSLATKMNTATDHADTLVAVLWAVTIVIVVIALAMTLYSTMTLGNLRQGMGKIGNSVQQVASAASQSSNAISMVADGSKQQSQAIEQAVTAVNQSVAVLSDVSSNAERATQLSKEAATTVDDGQQQMADMIAVVNRIAENSTKINKITEVISNIASQTNMLSLNAAIEAARAGEHGKGFAVVADQVRTLAESSKSSVQEIVDLLSLATRDANDAVGAADRVNEEMGKISVAASETEKMMQGIATSMEEQVATTEELQHNMDTLKGIGNNNANAAEEITQTILELSRIADETNAEVSKFHI